jgi:hypothetical protein
LIKLNLSDWRKWVEPYRGHYSYSDNATLIRCLTLLAIMTVGDPDLLDALIGLVDRLAT